MLFDLRIFRNTRENNVSLKHFTRFVVVANGELLLPAKILSDNHRSVCSTVEPIVVVVGMLLRTWKIHSGDFALCMSSYRGKVVQITSAAKKQSCPIFETHSDEKELSAYEV